MSNRPVPYPYAEDDPAFITMDLWEMNRYDERYMQPAEVRIKALEDAGGGGVATGSILDLKGVPSQFPTSEQCYDTDWLVLAKSDGIYFRNPLTCEEFKPKAFSLKALPQQGATHFLHLEDTPASFETHAGKLLKVSDCETRVEFVDAPVSRAEYNALLAKLERLESYWGPAE